MVLEKVAGDRAGKGILRIRIDAHVPEDVAEINLGHVVGRLPDWRAFAVINLRIRRAVVILDFFDDLQSGGLAIRIVCLQDFHGFFVDVRKLRIDQPSRYPCLLTIMSVERIPRFCLWRPCNKPRESLGDACRSKYGEFESLRPNASHGCPQNLTRSDHRFLSSVPWSWPCFSRCLYSSHNRMGSRFLSRTASDRLTNECIAITSR
jgi:hypothetical protein